MWRVIRGTLASIPEMYPVLLVLVIDGVSLGVYSSEITHLIPKDTDPDLVNKVAGVAMIVLGVGSTVGGFACGKVADWAGGLFAGRLGLGCWVGSCGCFLLALHWPQLWLTLLASFLWGFSLFYIEGWMYVTCSRNYQGRAEAFSVNKQLHSWFYLFFQVAVFATGNRLALGWLVPAMALLALPALWLLNRLPPDQPAGEKLPLG
jgi:predicted MFS family arabinose efflux permease